MYCLATKTPLIKIVLNFSRYWIQESVSENFTCLLQATLTGFRQNKVIPAVKRHFSLFCRPWGYSEISESSVWNCQAGSSKGWECRLFLTVVFSFCWKPDPTVNVNFLNIYRIWGADQEEGWVEGCEIRIMLVLFKALICSYTASP
jgi:hypothetical protein